MRVDVLLGDAHKLLNVLHTVARLVGVLSTQSVYQARLCCNGFDDLVDVALEGLRLLDDLQEVQDGVADAGRGAVVAQRKLAAGLHEGAAALSGNLGDAVLGGGADAAGRFVDDTAGRHVVGGVHGKLEVGREVANLHAVEEARATHDGVRDAGLHQAVFQNARLGVRAIEKGDVAVGDALVVQALDLAGNVV